jgi:hypothetical protein
MQPPSPRMVRRQCCRLRSALDTQTSVEPRGLIEAAAERMLPVDFRWIWRRVRSSGGMVGRGDAGSAHGFGGRGGRRAVENLPGWPPRRERGRLWLVERHNLPGCAPAGCVRELLQGAPRGVAARWAGPGARATGATGPPAAERALRERSTSTRIERERMFPPRPDGVGLESASAAAPWCTGSTPGFHPGRASSILVGATFRLLRPARRPRHSLRACATVPAGGRYTSMRSRAALGVARS